MTKYSLKRSIPILITLLSALKPLNGLSLKSKEASVSQIEDKVEILAETSTQTSVAPTGLSSTFEDIADERVIIYGSNDKILILDSYMNLGFMDYNPNRVARNMEWAVITTDGANPVIFRNF